MIILIDIDNTCRNTWKHYSGIARYVAPDLDWPERGPEDYWFLRPLSDHPRIDQLNALWYRSGLFEYAHPYPGAVDAIKELANVREVYLVTQPMSGSDTAASENTRWVCNWFGPEWESRLIQTHDRTLLQADVLIDDKPQIFGAIEFPTWAHIIYDQPYNQGIRRGGRLTSWSKVKRIVDLVTQT